MSPFCLVFLSSLVGLEKCEYPFCKKRSINLGSLMQKPFLVLLANRTLDQVLKSQREPDWHFQEYLINIQQEPIFLFLKTKVTWHNLTPETSVVCVLRFSSH